MRTPVVTAALAMLMLTQAGMGALAADKAQTQGPLTSSNNAVWQVTSFPLRIVTSASGLLLGGTYGAAKGIVKTEGQFAQNTFGRADENPLLVPVGLVGTVVAIPVGLVKGAPDGAVRGGAYGYKVWDNF